MVGLRSGMTLLWVARLTLPMEEYAGRIGTVVLSRATGRENGGEMHGALLLA